MTNAIRLVLGLLTGAYMLADGIYASQTGSYLGSGLGLWSNVVGALGIHPRSYFMFELFIVYGVFWLSAVAFYLAKRRIALAVMAGLSLWYLPIGTLCSAIILATYALKRKPV